MNIIGFIPTKYNYDKFPGKPLSMVAGKTIMRLSYDAWNSSIIHPLYFVTDHDTVKLHASTFKANVFNLEKLNSNNHINIIEAYRKYKSIPNAKKFEVVANIPVNEYKPDFANIEDQLFMDNDFDIICLASDIEKITIDPENSQYSVDINKDHLASSVINYSEKAKNILTNLFFYKTSFLESINIDDIKDLSEESLLNNWIQKGVKIKVIKSEVNHYQVFTYDDVFKLI